MTRRSNKKRQITLKRLLYGGVEEPTDSVEDLGLEKEEDKLIDTGDKYIIDDDGKYKGEYIENRNKKTYHGKGKYVYNDYMYRSYDGHWKNGKKHGKGILTYDNGAIYDGEWKDNKKHGTGTLTHNGTVIHRGKWENDEPVYKYETVRRRVTGDPFKTFMAKLQDFRYNKFNKQHQAKNDKINKFGYDDVTYGDPNEQNEPFEPQ